MCYRNPNYIKDCKKQEKNDPIKKKKKTRLKNEKRKKKKKAQSKQQTRKQERKIKENIKQTRMEISSHIKNSFLKKKLEKEVGPLPFNEKKKKKGCFPKKKRIEGPAET